MVMASDMDGCHGRLLAHAFSPAPFHQATRTFWASFHLNTPAAAAATAYRCTARDTASCSPDTRHACRRAASNTTCTAYPPLSTLLTVPHGTHTSPFCTAPGCWFYTHQLLPALPTCRQAQAVANISISLSRNYTRGTRHDTWLGSRQPGCLWTLTMRRYLRTHADHEQQRFRRRYHGTVWRATLAKLASMPADKRRPSRTTPRFLPMQPLSFSGTRGGTARHRPGCRQPPLSTCVAMGSNRNDSAVHIQSTISSLPLKACLYFIFDSPGRNTRRWRYADASLYSRILLSYLY